MNYDDSVGSLLALGRELAAAAASSRPEFGLENIAVLSADLGNPHRAIPCAHIAGTNGKGSTAAILESILRSAGLRTGLYTSPHLERINERIRLNGEPVSNEIFAAAWTRVHASIESLMASGKLTAHPHLLRMRHSNGFPDFCRAATRLRYLRSWLGWPAGLNEYCHARTRRHHAHRFRS